MSIQPIIRPIFAAVQENPIYVTQTSAVTSLTLWGLHISDIAALIAALAAVMGVALQWYVAMHKIRRLEKGLDANNIVTDALAESHRVLDKQVQETTDNGSTSA